MFTFCGICITSNSAQSTPRTNPCPSHHPRDIRGCLQDCRMHRLTQIPPWGTKAALRHPKLRHLAASAWIIFYLFFKIYYYYYYLHFVHARARSYRGGGSSLLRDLFKKTSLKLANTVWHIRGGLGTAPAPPCSTWKANSKVELSQAFAELEIKEKKKPIYTQREVCSHRTITSWEYLLGRSFSG